MEPTTDEIDHDRLFKELLTTFFAEFVEAFLPDLNAYLDRDSIEFLDKEVFTDVTQGKKYESDLVVRARFQGKETFFLILVENQSTSQTGFPKRMFTYFARFYEKFDLPIYPVVIYSFKKPARRQPAVHRVSLPGFEVMRFRFRVVQLNRLRWRDYLGQPNPAATALMAKMKIAERDRIRVKLQCLRLIATLKLDPARAQLIAGFVHAYLRLSAQESPIFAREWETLSPEERKTMLTLTNEWIESGIERGIERGIEQGIAQGIAQSEGRWRTEEARALVLKLGEKRFGATSPAVVEALESASLEKLETLAERLLDVKSWEELLNS
jgi:predicted transposase YdaD